MSRLISTLLQVLDRPVVDKTGLEGLYNFKLQWVPDGLSDGPPLASGVGASPPSGPSLFTAIQEQLGLRLVSTRGPVDVIVIDSVQKPTPN